MMYVQRGLNVFTPLLKKSSIQDVAKKQKNRDTVFILCVEAVFKRLRKLKQSNVIFMLIDE